MDIFEGSTGEKFIEEAEVRGDDPEQTLQKLMMDYIRGDDLSSRVDDLHEALVKDEQSGEVEATVEIGNDGDPAEAIETYDPEDSQQLTKEALRHLPEIESEEEVVIDKDDICGEIPQDVAVKKHLVVACARYEHDIVRRDQLREVASYLGLLGSDYKQRQYVDEPWESLVTNGFDLTKAFTSVDAALRYLDRVLESDDERASLKVEQITRHLHEHNDVDAGRLNSYREEVGVDSV